MFLAYNWINQNFVDIRKGVFPPRTSSKSRLKVAGVFFSPNAFLYIYNVRLLRWKLYLVPVGWKPLAQSRGVKQLHLPSLSRTFVNLGNGHQSSTIFWNPQQPFICFVQRRCFSAEKSISILVRPMGNHWVVSSPNIFWKDLVLTGISSV